MFTFNGKHVTDSSLGVTRYIRTIFSLLPGTRDNALEIAGLDGALDFGRELQPRNIRAQFLIRRDTPAELFQYARAVAAWLNVREPKQFIYDHEPDKFYLVRPQGGVSFDRILVTGGLCDVTFIAHDPYAHAVTPKTVTSFPATNSGTLPTPCIITATIAAETDSLKVTLAETGKYIKLARELEADDEIYIDTGQRFIAVNGVDARGDVTFESTWFMLPRGEFTLNADPESTELKITFRERWI